MEQWVTDPREVERRAANPAAERFCSGEYDVRRNVASLGIVNQVQRTLQWRQPCGVRGCLLT